MARSRFCTREGAFASKFVQKWGANLIASRVKMGYIDSVSSGEMILLKKGRNEGWQISFWF